MEGVGVSFEKNTQHLYVLVIHSSSRDSGLHSGAWGGGGVAPRG